MCVEAVLCANNSPKLRWKVSLDMYFAQQQNRKPKSDKGRLCQILINKQKAIAKRAYELYEKRGRGDGHTSEDWLQAEREITEKEKENAPINLWVQALIVPVVISLATAYITSSFNSKREEVSRIQTMEKFIEYFVRAIRPNNRQPRHDDEARSYRRSYRPFVVCLS